MPHILSEISGVSDEVGSGTCLQNPSNFFAIFHGVIPRRLYHEHKGLIIFIDAACLN
jgi:hypothetical protein